jgi:hypothetical protein
MIETNIRQSPAMPGFFIGVALTGLALLRLPRDNPPVMFDVVDPREPADPRGAKLLHLKLGACMRAKCKKPAC